MAGTTEFLLLMALNVHEQPKPASGECREPISRADAAPSPTVLVVEDEESVRRLVLRLLRKQGFRVMESPSGRAAFELWEKYKQEIDLVLTDMVMPDGISGRELGERLLRDKPGLPVVYTSGYNVEVASRQFRLVEGVNFVQKPYHPEHLIRTIRAALNRGATT